MAGPLGPEGDEFEADELTAVTDLTTIRDADPAWDFIGVNSGDSFYVFPETRGSFGSLHRIGTVNLLLVTDWSSTLTLTGFSGPGHFSPYTVIAAN